MINFIKHFSQYTGSFEFILNNENKIDKILYYFKENNSNVIFDFIDKNIKLSIKIQKIFNLYRNKINHIGYDKRNNRYKFYIGLYNNNFKESLTIIKNCKDILSTQDKYILEKDFYKFDSIGFDITKKGINIKVYELIKKENNYEGLPNNIQKEYVKEIGYLKDFYGRKKKFFRFRNYEDIGQFNNYFNTNIINIFKKEIKDYYFLQKKVKYFCIEGNKKEIYFI